jgi:hypothetical protein
VGGAGQAISHYRLSWGVDLMMMHIVWMLVRVDSGQMVTAPRSDAKSVYLLLPCWCHPPSLFAK